MNPQPQAVERDDTDQALVDPPIRCELRVPDPAATKRATELGYTPIQAHILGCRLKTVQELERLHSAQLSTLDDPAWLPDIDEATNLILEAITQKKTVALLCDHDMDGQGCSSVLYRALVSFGHDPELVKFFTSHRLTEGYGINTKLCDRVLASDPLPALVITADNGSSDEPRIARLREHGIQVIVSDHHGFPEGGPPKSANACVSPIREDSAYPDRSICGAMVAWLLMCHVRRVGIERGILPASTPSLRDLLGYVALATVADCVSLASGNNRAIIREGLRQIMSSSEPYAVVLRESLCGEGKVIDEGMIGFQVAPRIAAHGRLDEAMPGIRFLLSQDLTEARELFGVLCEANETRKEIQRDLGESAIHLVRDAVAQGRRGLAIHLEDGMSGVHGITASRVTETFGLPSVMISPWAPDPDIVSMSFRSVEGLDLKAVLDAIARDHPEALKTHGGHPMACGAKALKKNVLLFQNLFDQYIKEAKPDLVPERLFRIDGDLSYEHLELSVYEQTRALAPYGRGFEAPQYRGAVEITEARMVGNDPVHLSFVAVVHGRQVRGILFHAIEQAGMEPPFAVGDTVEGVFQPVDNLYRGAHSIQLQCLGVIGVRS